MRGVAGCDGGRAADRARAARGLALDAERSTARCGSCGAPTDRLLPWPAAAARYRDDWLPHADWVELEGVGHCPQLDVPLETAQLILGFTAREAGALGPRAAARVRAPAGDRGERGVCALFRHVPRVGWLAWRARASGVNRFPGTRYAESALR